MIEILFCLIVGITDGDTLTARCGDVGSYEQVKVRLVAIDAPERGQPFAERSKQYLSSTCYKKQATITVYYTDRYKRKVAEVACDDVNAGAALVEEGLAWVYPQFAKKHEWYYGFQDHAKSEKLGVWSQSNPIPPWEWRKKK